MGQKRSSLIIDPPEWGRVSPHSPPAAQQRGFEDVREGRRSDAPREKQRFRDSKETPGAYDDPERRPPSARRCLLGFRFPPRGPRRRCPDYFFTNNLHQIVQTPNSVMILHRRWCTMRESCGWKRRTPAEEHSPSGWEIPSAHWEG